MILPIILGAVVAIIALVLIIAANKPGQFRIERSTNISAPPEKVFSLINDFHSWASWSPWEGLDPNLKRTFSGASTGKGSVYEWTGNKKVGTGRMEVLQSTPSTHITIKLDFISPFEAHNTAEFTLSQSGPATKVTWAMYGPNAFVSKLMSVFINMQNLIGKDFEKGLAAMKAKAEGR